MNAERNPTELADVRCDDEAWVFEEEFLVRHFHTKTKAPLLFKSLKNSERLFQDSKSRMPPLDHLIGVVE